VSFKETVFIGEAHFERAHFAGSASFEEAQFNADAFYTDARFSSAYFWDAQFSRRVAFSGAEFDWAAFDRVNVNGQRFIGPVRASVLSLTGAIFAHTVEISAEAERVLCDSARFEEGVTLRLRRAAVEAARVMFGAPSSISGVGEAPSALMSLAGTDVSNLVITDVDLSWCEFSGAHRLDQLRIEGRCPFLRQPRRLARRQVIADEYIWRDWSPRHPSKEHARPIGPERLAAVYRSLRKALEDGKNEAGAGDFYYGEMEARRTSAATPPAERFILLMYWLFSGYGQRAFRALAALGALVAAVTCCYSPSACPVKRCGPASGSSSRCGSGWGRWCFGTPANS
jgi:uncharacterized protein YjbI with pentapeptide repeats